MKSRRSLGSAIAVDTVVKQSNKRRKSVDAKLINDKDNHCDKNNDDDDDNNNNKVKENKEMLDMINDFHDQEDSFDRHLQRKSIVLSSNRQNGHKRRQQILG